MTTWTFETLCQADKPTLERVLRGTTALEPSQLARGRAYEGRNLHLPGRLVGAKFVKYFYEEDERYLGRNHQVRGGGPAEVWTEAVSADGGPVVQGTFTVQLVELLPFRALHRPYKRLLLLDYNRKQNAGIYALLRLLGDFIGLPNPGDETLILGKAYVPLRGPFNFTMTYFVLRERIG